MKYMNDNRCPYKILIADGGDNINLENHLRDISNYKNLDYEYIRYPFDASINDFYKKLDNVISRVNSDYILLADNDDFFILEQIPKSINFLDHNNDFVSARGALVNFEVYDNLGNTKAKVHGAGYHALLLNAPSIDSNDNLVRVRDLCDGMAKFDYYSNWYSITRSSLLKDIWRNLLTLPVKEVIVLEVLTHCLLVNSGKIKIFSDAFYLRQSDTSEFGDTLVVKNEFLERSISNNAFSDFVIATDNFFGDTSNKKHEKKVILDSIASWLNIFILTINTRNKLRSAPFYRYINFLKKYPNIWYRIKYALIYFKDLFLGGAKRTRVKIKEIEPYLINKY